MFKGHDSANQKHLKESQKPTITRTELKIDLCKFWKLKSFK
jgi:hypothetical protein